MLNVVEEEEVRQFSLFSMYFIYYLVVQYCPYLRYHCVSKKKHKDLFETKLKKCAYLKPRRWVARNLTVWRTHTRTSIIDPHALPHRTLIFDDRTRTRTRTFSKTLIR